MIDRIHQLIKRSETPPDSVIELLSNTLIGTEGMLYQLMDTKTKIHELVDPHFLYMERNGKAIGNITICERPITLNDQKQDSLYIRYFAFDTIFQGGSEKGRSNSSFHTYFKSLFETSNFDPLDPESKKSIYWAFIDPQNMRSFNMNERFGFQTIGRFHTYSFSRITPKKISSVERLQHHDKEEVKLLIQEFYKDFNFYSDVHLFDHDNFFVLRQKGEIVAGIQTNPVRFNIKNLPGASGKLLIKLLPVIPGMRKLINPKEHKFLATEGIFWKKGFEDKIQGLLEGTLFLTQHHSMLLWVDDQNKMLEDLNIRWGIIQKTKKNNAINIVAKFNGFEKNEIDKVYSAKKYLSGFDMT
ncbi:MAG: hypothetical protein R2780_00185 [Crocinitomicaceae bacterium]